MGNLKYPTFFRFFAPAFFFAVCVIYFSRSVAAAEPQRIVSINLCTDELLLQTVEPSRILAVTRYEKSDPAEKIMGKNPGIRKIKGTVEEILALQPDLVLAGEFNNPWIVRFLKSRGIRILMPSLANSLPGIADNICELALETANPEACEAARKQAGTLSAEKKSLSPRVIFYQAQGNVPGAGTFEDAILEAAGARNIAKEWGVRGHRQVSLEKLIAARPDAVVVTGRDVERKSQGQELLWHPAIRKGLKNAKIIVVPEYYFSCGSPLSFEAVKILSRAFSDAKGDL